MIMSIIDLKKDLLKLSNPQQAKILQRFFKTAPGEYAQGDLFLGIKVPEQRVIANKYHKILTYPEIQKLLQSKYHEHRLTALFILIKKYLKSDEAEQKTIFDLYLQNTKYINNWDLVDSSTPNIVGTYILNKDKNILYQLANSADLWEKRIAIMATFTFIKNQQFQETLKISEILLHDQHDLIHKAVGWMLREIGNRDLAIEEQFLKKYHSQMPRTMLRYALEKFPEEKRKFYMKK